MKAYLAEGEERMRLRQSQDSPCGFSAARGRQAVPCQPPAVRPLPKQKWIICRSCSRCRKGSTAQLCCLRWARLSIASESCCFTSERPLERDRPSWEGGEPGWGTMKRPQVNRAAYKCAQVPSSSFTLGSWDSCWSAGRSFTLLFLCICSHLT